MNRKVLQINVYCSRQGYISAEADFVNVLFKGFYGLQKRITGEKIGTPTGFNFKA